MVEGDPVGIYHMFVDQSLDRVTVRGDRELLTRLLDAVPIPVDVPAEA